MVFLKETTLEFISIKNNVITTNKITMPRLIKKKLQTTAKKKFPGDKERQNAYVYGTLAKIEKSKK